MRLHFNQWFRRYVHTHFVVFEVRALTLPFIFITYTAQLGWQNN